MEQSYKTTWSRPWPHLNYAGSTSRRWLPKVMQTFTPTSRPHDAWAFLAGGFAYDQDQHTVNLTSLEEVENVQLAKAAGTYVNPFPAPDEVVARKFLKSNLSEEARFVVDLILNGPAEVLEAICTPIHHRPTKPRIKKFLERLGWSADDITDTIQELTVYVGEL